MNSCKNNLYNIYALHGFLGLASDWIPFPFINHPVAIERSELNLFDWGRQFNMSVKTGEQKNILLGYSMGGRLAMHALLENPGLWDAVILVSTHPGLQSVQERAERLKSDERWAERFLNDPWEDLMRDWNNNPIFDTHPFPLPRNEASFDRKSLSQQLLNWSLGNQEPLLDKLSELSIPTLVIAGQRDTKFCAISENFSPFSQVSIISQAAHRVPWDQSIKFTNQITNFIKDIV